MADPGLAFAFGQDRDPAYENIRQGLLYRPPAITRDTLEWPCTPEACRLLARQRELRLVFPSRRRMRLQPGV